jgi:hypothetical protein
MVDNGASYSISNNIDDFIEPPTKIGPKIQGFAGSLTTSLIGTVQWYITDDNGRTHSIILPYTSYAVQLCQYKGIRKGSHCGLRQMNLLLSQKLELGGKRQLMFLIDSNIKCIEMVSLSRSS